MWSWCYICADQHHFTFIIVKSGHHGVEQNVCLKDKSRVGIIQDLYLVLSVDYSRDYTVVNGVWYFFNFIPF